MITTPNSTFPDFIIIEMMEQHAMYISTQVDKTLHFVTSKKKYKRYIFLFSKCYLYFFILVTLSVFPYTFCIFTLNQHICILLMSTPHLEPLCVPDIALILLLRNQHSDCWIINAYTNKITHPHIVYYFKNSSTLLNGYKK